MKSHPVFRATRAVAIALGVLTVATATAAQETVRYVTSEEGAVFMESPMGAMEVEVEGYSEIVFEVSGASLVARYDTIFSYVGGTMGDQSPDITPLRDGSFELEFERPGVVRTISHPVMESAGAGGIDPLHSFDDFFVPLPDGPLEVGLEWTETLVHDGSSLPEATYYMERAMTMRVERDTVFNGTPAFVVSVNQDVSSEATGVIAGMGAQFLNVADGTDNGFAIITGDGTLLYRERQVDMAGLFSVDVQGQALDMPQTMTFSGRAELVSGGP